MQIGKEIDQFWIDNSLQISADEQVGFIKRMYFEQLPFTLRTQTIVRGMMLREDSNGNKLYYKTGWGYQPNGKSILWVVGFVEHKELVKEHKNSMNKSNERNYPYFFALNFDVPKDDQSKDWAAARIELLKKLLTADDAFDKR
jgi:beta-lactamase class D